MTTYSKWDISENEVRLENHPRHQLRPFTMSSEHRRNKRKRADVIVQVTNAITGEVMGRVGNLSTDGMMLVASKPVREDALYQVSFQLPGVAHTMEVGLHEMWSEPANVPGQFWAGFHFIDIGDSDEAALMRWLNGAGD